jgi:hypothetical protein
MKSIKLENIKAGDVLAVNSLVDGNLYKVQSVTTQPGASYGQIETVGNHTPDGRKYRSSFLYYSCFQRPTKAQLAEANRLGNTEY